MSPSAVNYKVVRFYQDMSQSILHRTMDNCYETQVV